MTAAAALAHVTPSPRATLFRRDPETSIGDSAENGKDVHSTPLHREREGDGDRFDPRFVLPKCEMPPQSEYAPVETFVANAIEEQHKQLNDTVPLKNYKGILEALRFKNDLPLLRKIMLALRTSGNGLTLNLLTRKPDKHARLIHQLVRFNPFELPPLSTTPSGDAAPQTVDYGLADAQFNLAMALVSANTVFLVPTLRAFWKLLTFQIDDAPEERTRRVHAALATLMRLCPKGRSEIFPIMAGHAPFRTKPEPQLVWYFKQCLHVIHYIPTIRDNVLELIVDRCLEMDVEIRIHDGGDATIGDGDSDDEDVIGQGEKETTEDKLLASVTVDEMADKLDSLMLLLFDFVQSATGDESTVAAQLYATLARIFESSILITHKSKFVQFLVFHLCSLESDVASRNEPADQLPPAILYRDFAAKLIDIIVDPLRATVTRQTGACYLASFVSRASCVCPETVCESVSALMRWAEAYIESLGKTSIFAADARNQCSLHSLFYTVCQAAFYIMCFRGTEAVAFHREAMDQTRAIPYEYPEQIDIGLDRWTRLCSHLLLPLRYCLESVRVEFLRVSRVHHLMTPDVQSKLEADDRRLVSGLSKKLSAAAIVTPATLESKRRKGGVGGLGRGTNPLDSFFPFDPYLLCRSHVFVEPYYKHWDGSVGEHAEEQDDGADETRLVTGDDDDEVDDDDDSSLSDDESTGTTSEDDSEVELSVDKVPDDPPNVRRSRSSTCTSLSSALSAQKTAESALSQVIFEPAWARSMKRARAPSIENGSW